MTTAAAALVLAPAPAVHAASAVRAVPAGEAAPAPRDRTAVSPAAVAGRVGAVTGTRGVPGSIDLVGLDFQLINDNSRRCLVDAGDGRALVQKGCGRGAAYRWRFAPVTVAGTFRIIHVGT